MEAESEQVAGAQAASGSLHPWPRHRLPLVVHHVQLKTRIFDMAVVPYRQDQAPRLDFWGSAVRKNTREGDTLWVNYTTSHFSLRSTVS